jgi:hypothetical protein
MSFTPLLYAPASLKAFTKRSLLTSATGAGVEVPFATGISAGLRLSDLLYFNAAAVPIAKSARDATVRTAFLKFVIILHLILYIGISMLWF